MMEFLSAVATYLFNQFDMIWALYTGGGVFACAIVLWVLDRLFHIFDILKR